MARQKTPGAPTGELSDVKRNRWFPRPLADRNESRFSGMLIFPSSFPPKREPTSNDKLLTAGALHKNIAIPGRCAAANPEPMPMPPEYGFQSRIR
jgi:hypothetical protein